MGRNAKPLKVLLPPSLLNKLELRRWVEKGHELWDTDSWERALRHDLVDVPSLVEFDLVIGSNCWRITENMLKYLDEAEKSARRNRYPAKEGATKGGEK